ncbi:HK97 family phage prohead protease, partial [Acinetobacter sp. NS4_7]
EVKSLQADGTFAGYASVFGIVDSQRDIVLPGAFSHSLKSRKQPVQLLWQHQWESPIGSITKLFEDARGLYVQGKLLMEVAR